MSFQSALSRGLQRLRNGLVPYQRQLKKALITVITDDSQILASGPGHDMSESLGLYQTDRQRTNVAQVRMLAETEKAWLAAAIDGEGSIGFYDFGREGRRVSITISNTNEPFIRRVKEIVGCGGSITRTAFASDHKGRKPIYHYNLKGSARCYKLLKQITPFLIIKREKAEKIIVEIDSHPFGRWMNATLEYRKKNSERLRHEWADPTIRQHRLNGMRRWQEFRKGGGGQP